MTPAELVAQAREVTEGVTDGPWEFITREQPHAYVAVSNNEWAYFGKHPDAKFVVAARTLVPDLADALEAALTEAKDRELAHVIQMSRVMGEAFDEGYAAATAAALLAAETAVDEYNTEVGCGHTGIPEATVYDELGNKMRTWLCIKCGQRWTKPA